eukprot:8236101-Pyramimonas_sp.AAC.2
MDFPRPLEAEAQWGKESDGKGTGVHGGKPKAVQQLGATLRVQWFRVVLDEAQMIKNARTQSAKACWAVRAKRRWCLSGERS